MAHHYGGIIIGAEISNAGGHVIWNAPIPFPSPADCRWMKLTAALAGAISDNIRNQGDDGWDEDLKAAQLHATALLTSDIRPTGYSGPFTLEWLITSAREDIQRILAHRQDKLEALAAALLEHKSLTGREIHALLDETRRGHTTATPPHALASAPDPAARQRP